MRISGTIVLLMFAGAVSGDAAAQSALERSQRDEIIRVEKNDPEMASAIRQARATLPTFLQLARARRPTISTMALKVGVREGNDVEYFWINPFEQAGRIYAGNINNRPRTVMSVKYRDVILFRESEIVDWTYTESGRSYGNYTACALLRRDSPADRERFQQKYGLDCNTY